jgi:hypothetical protein
MLGHKPANTVWDNGLVFHPETERFMNKGDGYMHQSITVLTRGEATALTLGLDPDFLAYQKKYAGVTNVIQVTRDQARTNVFSWPEHSIPQRLIEKAERKPHLREQFRGKVYCPRMPYAEMRDTIAQFGGSTLITPEQAFEFNSKVRTAEQAESIGYNVAPHVVAYNWDQMESGIIALAQKAKDLGLDPGRTKYWIKFDGLDGGDGVRPFEPARESFNDVRAWVRHVMKESETPEGKFTPLLMDIDVGHLPEVRRVLGNFNVQGVAGPDGVYHTGTTIQKTVDGVYMGGALPGTREEKTLAAEAARGGMPVLAAAQSMGYRGYAGIDVLVCEGKNTPHVDFVLEMNGRINSSTSLLSTAQWVGREAGLGRRAEAFNISAGFAPMDNFAAFETKFGDVLYKGAESGHAGVIPILLKPDEQGRLKGVKTIAVAPDEESLARVEQRFNKRVLALG